MSNSLTQDEKVFTYIDLDRTDHITHVDGDDVVVEVFSFGGESNNEDFARFLGGLTVLFAQQEDSLPSTYEEIKQKQGGHSEKSLTRIKGVVDTMLKEYFGIDHQKVTISQLADQIAENTLPHKRIWVMRNMFNSSAKIHRASAKKALNKKLRSKSID